jgi:hypothetical protein
MMADDVFDDPLPGIPPVESPFFEEHAKARGWEGETLRIARDLHEHGFAALDFPEPRLAELAADIIESLDPRYEEQQEPGRIPEAWTIAAGVRAIAANAEILSLLGQLYGRRAIPFQTLNFRVGTQQRFHSDFIHFASRPERFMCGVWVAFEATDADNGPLVYYPGSHRLPLYGNEALGQIGTTPESPYLHHARFEAAWDRLVQCHRFEAEYFHAHQGQALIWTANLLHGGAEQRDPNRTRHSQVTHYFFDNCVYYCPMLSDPYYGRIHFRDVEDIATGERVAQQVAGHTVPEAFAALSQDASKKRPE